MATFNFVSKKKAAKDRLSTVTLTKHVESGNSKEYFTYTDGNGEHIYSGDYIKYLSDNTYVGKIYTTNKVALEYHPAVKSVTPQEAYFTYIDNNGNVKIFNSEPLYNSYTNTYFFETKGYEYTDNKVKLYTKD